jgi:hypothetical protein
MDPRRRPLPLAPIAVALAQFARAAGCALNTAIAFPKGLAGTVVVTGAARVRPAGSATPAKLRSAWPATELGSWPGGCNEQSRSNWTKKLMASASKLATMPSPAIEPNLKEFIDKCLVPILIREALAEFQQENHVASDAKIIGEFRRQILPATAEVAE